MSIRHLTSRLSRLRLAASHIDANLAAPLSLADLAEVAAMSRFHFQRVFTAYAGETPQARVRRLRLLHAREQLAAGASSSILEVALNCGYGSPEAFARAFRAQFGYAPSAQARGVRPALVAPLEIVHLSDLAIQYIPFSGQIDESILPFEELRARAMALDIPSQRRKGWSIHLSDDAERWDGQHLALRAALLSDRLGVRIPGIDIGTLPAGHYAVLPVEGGYDAPPRAEIAQRIATETTWRIARGPVLRCFNNATYLPAPSERKFLLYVPVAR